MAIHEAGRSPGPRRSAGPKTDAGKARSALNAVRHGLGGRSLLLPGEDPEAYATRLDGIFASLAPQDDAQAEVVALVADDIHKLHRLAKIEKAVTLGRIEELLTMTASGEKAGVISNAIQALGQALVAWSAEPVPTTRTPDFDRRYRSISEAVAFVDATLTAIPLQLIDACDAALDAVRGKKDDAEIAPSSYVKVFETCRVLMATLLDTGRDQDVEQDRLRASIATIALPDMKELAKLSKYRSMLELSVQRRLAALEQLRKLGSAAARSEEEKATARSYCVKLRVVA